MSQQAETPLGESSGAAPSIHERQRSAIVALVPRWYSPAVHLAVPSVLGLAVLIAAVMSLHAVRAVELLVIPATILLAFAFEHRAHRKVLHRRAPLLGVIYVRHELQHHVIYTYDDMAMRSPRELWLILMPAYAVVLVFIVNAPLAYGLATLLTPNTGLLFLVTSMSFFVSYEWMHLSYHLPATSVIGRHPWVARLRECHRRHHDPRLMKAWNFNVTVPVFDWIRGTLWSPEREAEWVKKRSHRRPASASVGPATRSAR